jgi:tetratricopeptide (TPR) repeat protein
MLFLVALWLQISGPQMSGEELYLAGRFAEAREALAEDVQSGKANAKTHFWLGYTYLALGDKPSAIEPFEQYLKSSPKDEDVLYALARTYAQLASMSLETIFTLDPKCARAYQMRGIRFELENAWSRAIASYQTAVELDPRIRGVWASMARIYEREFKDDAQARVAAAREPHEKALNKGVALIESRQPREALPHLLEWRTAAPQDPDVYYYLGEAYTDLKVATIQKLRDANAASYRLHQILAENYASIHRKQEAVEEYRQVLKLQPALPGVHYEMARLLADSTPDEARRLLEQELEIDPQHYMAQSLLGQLLVATRDGEKAIPLLQAALRRKASLVDARRALGKALLEIGKPGEALEQLQRVASENPDDEQVHFLLSQTWRALDKPAEASQEMKTHQEVLRRLAGQ